MHSITAMYVMAAAPGETAKADMTNGTTRNPKKENMIDYLRGG
jgi:hypothetical protein